MNYIKEKDLTDLGHTCKIYFGKSRYIDVFIWNSIDGLLRNTNFKNKNYCGAYIGYPYDRGKGLFGEIHLLRDEIGAGYVSHEFMHFVFDWMSGHKINYGERVAYLMSDVTNEFWNKFYEFYDVVPSSDGNIVPDEH